MHKINLVLSMWQIYYYLLLSNRTNTEFSLLSSESSMCQSIIIVIWSVWLLLVCIFVLWMMNAECVNIRFATNTKTINHNICDCYLFIIRVPKLDWWIGYVLSDTIRKYYVNVYLQNVDRFRCVGELWILTQYI